MVLNESLERIKKNECVIEVFGLGYVGFPLLIRLVLGGFRVLGIDKDERKLGRLSNGKLNESEGEWKTKFDEIMKSGKISFSKNSKASNKIRIGIIAVPTPVPSVLVNSDIFVNEAVKNFLKFAQSGDCIILESSVEVGTTEKVREVIESKGFKVGKDFGLSFCPERIDPLNKKWNLENIPRIIYCSGNIMFQIAQQIYLHVNNSNLILVDNSKTAEVIKSFENTFRLVNISLVNELAMLCTKLKINANEVINAAATKPFGFMPFYPGAGAGGHCIPKDPKFLLESAKKLGIPFETIGNALEVNITIPKFISKSIEKVIEENKLPKTVIVCGLAYKPDIEDMRDSPGFKIVKELVDKNFKVVGYDPFLKPDHKSYVLKENSINNLEVLEELDLEKIKDFSCLCIVQHHTQSKFTINEIYRNSIIPIIYDCQNKLEIENDSKTILERFGN